MSLKDYEKAGPSSKIVQGSNTDHPPMSFKLGSSESSSGISTSEDLDNKKAKTSWISEFSSRQWKLLAIFAIADLIAGVVYNIKGPFYPLEAESKGVTSTQYGFVFGVFDLTKVMVCPIYGKFMSKLGARRVFISAMMVIGMCSVLFGLLDQINNTAAFLALSLIIRIIEAVGSAGFSTSSFAIIAGEFPSAVATTFASLETFFGLGLMVGPLLGGLLFQAGGYPVPFITTGLLLFVLAIIILMIMPITKHTSAVRESLDDDSITRISNKGFSIFSILQIPGVILAALGVFAVASSAGFLTGTLEPHIRQFTLTPVETGVVFVIWGAVYALTAPAWGWLCDRISQPCLVTLVGACLNFVAFLLIGPAPFFPLAPVLWITCVGLVFHGLALGATFVSGFVLSLRYTIAAGFPNNMATYGVVSGTWTSVLSLGMFLGPSIGGILLDNVGFRWGSTFVLIAMILLIALIAMFLLTFGFEIVTQNASPVKSRPNNVSEDEPLIFRKAQNNSSNADSGYASSKKGTSGKSGYGTTAHD